MREQETKAAVRAAVCEACGADVRADTQFCYNCGASLQREAAPQDVSGAREADPAAPSRSAANGSTAPEQTIKAGPGMRSAAAIRKDPKAFQRKPVQIAWEPAEGESNFSLVVTAIAFLAFALAAVALALYNK